MSSTDYARMTTDEAARAAAGNYRSWEAFYWDAEPEDGDRWALWVISHRDADALTESNAAAIVAELEPWASDIDGEWSNYSGPDGTDGTPDVLVGRGSHWAHGWTESVGVRCIGADGEVTEAFRAAHALMVRLASYPVLDEDDFYAREWAEGVDWADCEGPCKFGRAWNVFIGADDVVRMAFETGAAVTGDGWETGGVWEAVAALMGVSLD